MKLEQLELSNFRGFDTFSITFDPSFTVLLGENMAGKTAVLDGAAVALSGFFWSFDDKLRQDIEDDDVRKLVIDIGGVPVLQPQYPARLTAKVQHRFVGTEPDIWQVTRSEGKTRVFPDGAKYGPLGLHTKSESQVDLPVIAYFGTHRLWHGNQRTDERRGPGARVDGYEGCFDITSTQAVMVDWIRKQTLVQLQRGNGYIQPQLATVESAIKACIDRAARFWYDVQYDELRLERTGDAVQLFSMLSEGVRNIVAMVADIAWRCAVLNPQHGPQAHTRTEGVVLIDELDLHLHPAWQRRIVSDLRRTFPLVQFIVTTHSPQIVASVSRSQVRLLNRNRLVAEESFVEGRDTNEILEDVFGVPPRPEQVQAEIDAMYRAIEDEDFVAARERLVALQERLGPDDAAVIRARWIIETEEAQPRSASSAAP
jgi:predicted ATP-binding protein involved in virulence